MRLVVRSSPGPHACQIRSRDNRELGGGHSAEVVLASPARLSRSALNVCEIALNSGLSGSGETGH